MTRPRVELDHLAYLRQRDYRRRIHFALRRLPRGEVSDLVIVHERDDSCCRLQPWAETNAAIVAALNADGTPTLGMAGWRAERTGS